MKKETETHDPENMLIEVSEAVPKYDRHIRYTYADYITWGEDVKCELIDGIIYDMSPAPGSMHQDISGNIFGQLFIFLEGKPCKVYHAPFDVRLDPNGADRTVVQPDILVICDRSIITKAGCSGAPDMVIEILSPSNAMKDMMLKSAKYQLAGVREIWMIDPVDKVVMTFYSENGEYKSIHYINKDKIPVKILEGCSIDMARVFAETDIFGVI